MTKPRYRNGCAAVSQEHGVASSPAANSPEDYAWNVNLHNGNANWNNRNNSGFVLAVAPSEYHDAVPLRALYSAWRAARRGKKPSTNRLRFDARWPDGIRSLRSQLMAGTWHPGRPTCFIATLPKAREIHAPDFSDRVVHHWIVPKVEALYEPIFVHDCFSNRKGKGTHAAVDRLCSFAREVHSGQGGGWYLQLDIHNFFNCIRRPILYRLLKARMETAGLSMAVRHGVHALLRHPADRYGINYACTEEERRQVPRHKRLENAVPGCGLPIGNLSSQFFANVYLNELDQFVKHTLKARRYLRYVDDFVLVHQDRAQLRAWQTQIERFLEDRLKLTLKPDIKLRRLESGIDFLGYIVYPTHTLVRRRVINHARQKLDSWAQQHVRGFRIAAAPSDLRRLRSTWASYSDGHFARANSWRLQRRFQDRYPWLGPALASPAMKDVLDDRVVNIRVPRGAAPAGSDA